MISLFSLALILSSIVLLCFVPQTSFGAYPQWKCPSANMTAIEMSGNFGHPQYYTCLEEIKKIARTELDKVYGLITREPDEVTGDACPGVHLEKDEAESNLKAFGFGPRSAALSSMHFWESGSSTKTSQYSPLDYQTFSELLAEEQGLEDSYNKCISYFKQREDDLAFTRDIAKDYIDEEKAKEMFGGEQGTKNFYDSNCVIATAAFGSEIAPQVQFLRNFRDNHILSTASGSSFMNVFNSWYYSFSPSVADYERDHPWMQSGVRVLIQPLLGILHLSERAYSVIPGEFGAMSAGLIASSMIGTVYFTPFAFSVKRIRKSKFLDYKIALLILAIISSALIIAILVSNQTALMVTSAIFVLGIIGVSAIYSARVIGRIPSVFKWKK